MTIEKFIEQNREEIDKAIRNVCSNCKIDDEERENWIMNDEGLYNWALSSGVEI